MTEQDQLTAFRQRNKFFLWVATAALAAILFFVALAIFIVAWKGDVMATRSLIRMALAWAPVLFYIWALWSAREVFRTLSKEGFAFHESIARALTRIGLALTLGAAVSVFVGLYLLFTGQPGQGGFPVFNAPGLTIGIVGLALVAIGELVRKADDIRRTNAKLSEKLEGFV
jgi:hypothetical protein